MLSEQRMDVKIPRIFVIFRHLFFVLYIYTTTLIYWSILQVHKERKAIKQCLGLSSIVTFVLISAEVSCIDTPLKLSLYWTSHTRTFMTAFRRPTPANEQLEKDLKFIEEIANLFTQLSTIHVLMTTIT